jgi:TPR repeat protein
MAFIPRRTILLAAPLALCLAQSGCALDAPERRETRHDWPMPDEIVYFPEPLGPPTGGFEVECRSGISGCKAQASELCGYAGFRVLGSYKTKAARGKPQYHLRAACERVPSGVSAYPEVPRSPGGRPATGRKWDRRERSAEPGTFQVECRFEISACEREVWERCGPAGYRVLGSYQTQGAFGAPYFYMMAACGPAAKANPWTEVAGAATGPAAKTNPWTEVAGAAWDVVRLAMPTPCSGPAAEKNMTVKDPFEKSGSSNAERVASLETEATSGKADAQTTLAAMYANGDGVAADPDKAVEWYRRAADQGDATAQNNLALFYEAGESVPRDMAEAARWYRKAAEQGAAIAQYNLAVLYRIGLGVPKDGEQAAAWSTKAAIQEQANAQALLASLYARGEGVPRDAVLAYAWLNLAAAQGLESAAKARDGMLLALPELTEAQRISSAWKQGQTLQRQGAETEKKGRAPSRRSKE